ncbi:hypothetical protein ACJW30_02G147800 [Castanea mollissima]
MSHRKVHSQGSIPFSWEDKPGICKIVLLLTFRVKTLRSLFLHAHNYNLLAEALQLRDIDGRKTLFLWPTRSAPKVLWKMVGRSLVQRNLVCQGKRDKNYIEHYFRNSNVLFFG